jgi:hypothetical protein
MLVLASPNFTNPWASQLSIGFARLKPDGDLMNRHPAPMRFFERAKLRSCAEKAALFSLH